MTFRKIGYARVSREDQDLGRQIQSLKEAGCEIIYEDKISGAKSSRPQLDQMLLDLQAHDVVVVQKLDRLGRSLKDLIELVMKFKEKKVGFISLTEGFDTTNSAGELVFHIMGAIAQFERSMISERTKNSLAFKKSQGVRLGRPVKPVDKEMCKELVDMLNRGYKSHEIMEKFNLSRSTYYRITSKFVQKVK